MGREGKILVGADIDQHGTFGSADQAAELFDRNTVDG
jgi:hypothetical protein